VPDDIVVRCGLRQGLEVDRSLARELARELRRLQALTSATRALRARPLSEQRLRERLRSRGTPPAAEEAALAALAGAGLVDDACLAEGRAVALAARGWGDAAIAARLEAEGIAAEQATAALRELEPEQGRAARLAATVPDPRKAWALLARRGFSEDAIEGAVGALDETASGGLG
jgi:SOS response regulatory protein OraA/RecX